MVTVPSRHPRDLIAAYVLGALDEHDTKLVESHLSICQGCRDALSEARKAEELLGPTDGTPPPPDVWERILSQIRQERPG